MDIIHIRQFGQLDRAKRGEVVGTGSLIALDIHVAVAFEVGNRTEGRVDLHICERHISIG